MKRYRLNTSWLFGSVVTIILVAALTHAVHAWQMGRHARGQLVRANEAEQAGASDDLLLALNRYLRFDSSNRAIRVRYSLALAERANNPRDRWRALQVLRNALNDPMAPAEVRIRAAEVALDLEEPVEANRYLEPVLAQYPQRADLFELSARAYLASGDIAGAARQLGHALEVAPNHVSSAVMLVELLRDNQGQRRHAEAVLDQLIEDNPSLAAAWLARAQSRLHVNRLEEAEKDLARARALAPTDAEVLSTSANLALRKHQYEEAGGWLRQALKQRPESPELYLGLARAQREFGQPGTAVSTLRDGVRRLPDREDLRFTLADLLIDEGELAEARQLRDSLPETTAAGRRLFLDGEVARRDRQWLAAARAFTTALRESDLNGELAGRLLLDLAECYARMGAPDERLQAIRQSNRVSTSPRGQLELARILIDLGRCEEALPLLQSLSRLSHPPTATWGMLAHALLADLRSRPSWQRHWTDLDRALDRAAAIPGQQAIASVLRSEMLLLRRDSDEVRTYLEESLQRDPESPALHRAMADLAAREGDEVGVRQVLASGDAILGNRKDWLKLRMDRIEGRGDAEAIAELRQLERRLLESKKTPDDDLEWRLANLQARTGDATGVVRTCRHILERNPWDVRARLLLVEVCLARNDEAGAARLIHDLRRIEGPDGAGWRVAAVTSCLERIRRGDRESLPSARRSIEEIRKLRPFWSMGPLLAGRLAELEGNRAEALQQYRLALQGAEFHPHALARLVSLLGEKQNWNEATVLIEQARRRGLLDHDLLETAAWIALRAGKNDRACELAWAAVPPGTASYSKLVWRGRLLEAARRHTEAGEAFDEAIRSKPELAEAWLGRIEQLVHQKDVSEAIKVIAQMQTRVNPQLRMLATAQGQELLGNLGDAERTYRSFLAEKPVDSRALFRLANLYLRRNEPEKAEPILGRLLALAAVSEEDVPELRRQLALVITDPHEKRDRVKEALALLALNQRDLGSSEADRRVEALVRSRRAADRATALKMLDEMKVTAPEERLRLAWLCDVEGRRNQARDLLLGLTAEEPGNPGITSVLVDTLLRAGKKVEASTWLARLRELDPGSSRMTEFEERLRRLP